MEENWEEDRERIYRMRKMARKLASNRSQHRTIRKLPQSMVIELAPRPKRVVPVRKVINSNKRLTYILLLGISLCAYFYDVDQTTLDYVVHSVGSAAQSHLASLLGRT